MKRENSFVMVVAMNIIYNIMFVAIARGQTADSFKNDGSHKSQKQLVVDLKHFTFIMFDDVGKIILWGPCSGGRYRCIDSDYPKSCKTKHGEFKVLSKKGKYYKSPLYPKGCNNKSKDYKLRCAKMSWAIKFDNEGQALHGGIKGKVDSGHTSHGCVHFLDEHIKFLNQYMNVDDKITISDY